MKLWLKVLIILTGMWLIISISIFMYSRYTLKQEYVKLEKKEVIDNVEQTKKTLFNMLSPLMLLNRDWSEWDDAYQFMQNKNEAFIQSNLAFSTFANAKINLILFFDANGKFFYGKYFDLEQKKFMPLPINLINYLETEKSFTLHKTITSSKLGILKTTDGYVVLSSLPILTSEGKGPSHGALVMGFFFTGLQLEHLSDIVNLKVDFFPIQDTQKDPLLEAAYQQLQSKPYYIAAKDSNYMYGFTLLKDVDNNPVGILRITLPRDLYNQGISTIARYLAIIIGVGLLFILATWYLLKIFVLNRLENVSKKVVAISDNSKFSDRIAVKGHDELDAIATSINSLMEIIELTQEQLKYRIFLRTEELERLSKLNKNLYTEMSDQKVIESKLREDEKKLRKMAYYDNLTALPNRLFFQEMLQKLINKSEKDGSGITILFLDADRLKSINDTYGHDIGDLFLQHTATQLKLSIKESDVAARLAGDEFIICLPNVKLKPQIKKIAQKILENMSVPLIVNDDEIKSSFSIGISIYPEDGKTIEELEKHADLAMYYAKKLAGNTYFFYDETFTHSPTE